jgi:hypothetical protein
MSSVVHHQQLSVFVTNRAVRESPLRRLVHHPLGGVHVPGLDGGEVGGDRLRTELRRHLRVDLDGG